MKYKEAIDKAMIKLSQDNRCYFIGQSVYFKGNAMYFSLKDISDNRKIQFPVAQDFQLGFSIGMSMQGKIIPISIYPRFDFFVCAMNQLLNHLDKFEDMVDVVPHIIIRVAIGSTIPLHPGIQHCQDYTDGLKKLVKNIHIKKFNINDDIIKQYNDAIKSCGTYIFIEDSNLYDNNIEEK